MDANHKPVVKGQDNAIWNRLYLIPFTVTIPKAEQDPDLREKLKAEAEAILSWAVYGAQRWFKDRLGKPDEIAAAVDGWRKDSDDLSEFIAERCSITAGATSTNVELRTAYETWCQESGDKPIHTKRFKEELEDRGYVQVKLNKGRIWKGIALQEKVTGDGR